MRIEKGKIEGDIRVAEALQLTGMATGCVIVAAGGHFVLHGMVCRDVAVEADGVAEIRGMVCGDVRNLGGHLRVWGMVIGSVRREGGTTVVEPGAVIRERAG